MSVLHIVMLIQILSKLFTNLY